MNKDKYKKVINNYSNSPDVLEPTPRAIRTSPYVITFEEFCEDFEGHDKSTLTYYNADGVLVDEDETPVEDPNWTIGAETTDKFGVGSDDPDVVYVRNEKLKMDYEIVRLEGSYNTEEDL